MIRQTMLLFAFFITAFTGYSQDIHAQLMRQVDAFNSKDIETMTNNLSPDFKWYYIGSDTLMLEVEGKEAFRKSMNAYFESIASVHSSIEEYAIDGHRISFQEVVEYTTASGKEGTSTAMAIYAFKDGLIWRVWYFM